MRETRQFNVRIELALFDRVRERAKRSNASMGGVVQAALEQYLDGEKVQRGHPKTEVVQTSPIRTPAEQVAASNVTIAKPRVFTGEVEHCQRHPRAIVKDGECQTCRLEGRRA